MGRDKTRWKIMHRYFWPNMSTDIEEYVKSCEVCQKHGIANYKVWYLLTIHLYSTQLDIVPFSSCMEGRITPKYAMF